MSDIINKRIKRNSEKILKVISSIQEKHLVEFKKGRDGVLACITEVFVTLSCAKYAVIANYLESGVFEGEEFIKMIEKIERGYHEKVIENFKNKEQQSQE